MNYHELIAFLKMRVTIKAKVVTGNRRSPHNDNDSQMIEVARQPPYTLAMVRKSVKSGYMNQFWDARKWGAFFTYDVEKAKQMVTPRKNMKSTCRSLGRAPGNLCSSER